MARRRMVKKNVGQTPRRQSRAKPTAAELQAILAGESWFWAPKKRKSPGRPVIVLPFLGAIGGGRRAKPHAARVRRRSNRWRAGGRGLFELFGGPTRGRSASVLPFKKTVHRRG